MQKDTHTRAVERRSKLLIATTILIGVVDAASKYYALTRLPEAGGRVSFLSFALFKNPGIAFSIPLPGILTLLLSGAIIIFFSYSAFTIWHTNRRVATSAVIVIIGALGNFIDRLINGFTTDYIIFFTRSAINLSDILIVTGIILFFAYNENRHQTK